MVSSHPDEPLAVKLIEDRYKAEEELMAAITQGNMEKALNCLLYTSRCV